MKIVLYLGIITLFLFSCCDKNKVNYIINATEANSIKGDILFSKGNSNYYFDIEITENYIILLDSESDSVVQVYGKCSNNENAKLISVKKSDNNLMKPVFTKSIKRKNRKENIINIIDNNMYSRSIAIKKDKKEIEIQSSLLSGNITPCVDYAIVGKELYGTPKNSYKNYLFYYFNTDSGYYWVNSPSFLIKEASGNPYILVSNLYANEDKSVIATALRYSNYVCFFDLHGNLQSTIKFGSENISPKTKPIDNELDAPNSIKCFINMYGTSKYLYCLYTGSNDFSTKSKILVFNWDKKHIATLQTDRSLRCISVDEKDQYILGVSSNESDGQDIIQYQLKSIL